jgi:hypothetical protein
MNIASQILAAKQSGSTRLNISCGLTDFPREIYELADTLEILDLSGNNLSSLPDDFSKLHKLRILFCSDNQFTQLPAVLGLCPQLSMIGFKANKIKNVPAAALNKALRWLILTDNQISELPSEIGQCTQMQKLMLSGNQLATLPQELAACSKLELLRIAANHFTVLPEWLLNMPRLSWLAYAGNPCSEMNERKALEDNPITSIDWQQLEIHQKLGEGASGVIHQALWTQSSEIKTSVAIKLFKGALTSDGLPYSEKAACISAGAHPNLITVHGKLNAHPEKNKGLIMSLIAPNFRNLAGPPSLESCTRDIYPANTRFSLKTMLHLAHGIASAAQHLHSKGIMHGDLYAHNILYNDEGDCLLGDFGAASFYDLQDSNTAEALQHIEVRAFGCLLQELSERCEITQRNNNISNKINKLSTSCMQEENANRPLFQQIVNTIHAIQSAVCTKVEIE